MSWARRVFRPTTAHSRFRPFAPPTAPAGWLAERLIAGPGPRAPFCLVLSYNDEERSRGPGRQIHRRFRLTKTLYAGGPSTSRLAGGTQCSQDAVYWSYLRAEHQNAPPPFAEFDRW